MKKILKTNILRSSLTWGLPNYYKYGNGDFIVTKFLKRWFVTKVIFWKSEENQQSKKNQLNLYNKFKDLIYDQKYIKIYIKLFNKVIFEKVYFRIYKKENLNVNLFSLSEYSDNIPLLLQI